MQELKFDIFFETSAKNGEGIVEMFNQSTE